MKPDVTIHEPDESLMPESQVRDWPYGIYKREYGYMGLAEWYVRTEAVTWKVSIDEDSRRLDLVSGDNRVCGFRRCRPGTVVRVEFMA